MSLSLAGLVLLCLSAGVFVERSVEQLNLNQQVFDDRDIRNGFVSMSDLQRLLLIAQNGAVHGSLTPEDRRAFVEATDILFVRRDFFAGSINRDHAKDPAAEAIAALDGVIEIADRAIASDFPDIGQTWSELLPASDEARRALVLFQEIVTRFQNELMRDQAEAVRQQRLAVLTALAAITVVGAAALLLLRSEVLSRVARERAERHVEFLAYFDQLTKLPNRTQFQNRLDASLKAERPVALVLVDLDEFKGINDTYGHAAGDAVLFRVAQLLQSYAAHWEGFAARLGGDEFAMVLNTDHVEGLISSCELLL
ncbi:diguanylate cyclase [Marimonas sp. MJW-29]|uniref:Diguanylate cyclase n=1 Tax=Sulfitobacter sediminis TaxID=3234186 RepID=A0ABV3RGF1_9RHOB